MAIPDPASFTPIPFIKDGLAIVHCDPHVNGEPWPYAPRVILKALIQQAADAGFEPWVGAEVEYFLLHRNADGSLSVADAADTAAQPCYDARGVTRMYDHLTAISAAMNTLGWSNYANDHEDGNGQFEQNFQFADALTTADRVVTLRYLLTMIADRVMCPFQAKVIGEDVRVVEFAWPKGGYGLLAVCERDERQYKVDVNSLEWIEPYPEGFEWIEAHKLWREEFL